MGYKNGEAPMILAKDFQNNKCTGIKVTRYATTLIRRSYLEYEINDFNGYIFKIPKI